MVDEARKAADRDDAVGGVAPRLCDVREGPHGVHHELRVVEREQLCEGGQRALDVLEGGRGLVAHQVGEAPTGGDVPSRGGASLLAVRRASGRSGAKSRCGAGPSARWLPSLRSCSARSATRLREGWSQRGGGESRGGGRGVVARVGVESEGWRREQRWSQRGGGESRGGGSGGGGGREGRGGGGGGAAGGEAGGGFTAAKGHVAQRGAVASDVGEGPHGLLAGLDGRRGLNEVEERRDGPARRKTC